MPDPSYYGVWRNSSGLTPRTANRLCVFRHVQAAVGHASNATLNSLQKPHATSRSDKMIDYLESAPAV